MSTDPAPLTPAERAELARSRAAFDAAGGRGVEIAERIDALAARENITEPGETAPPAEGGQDVDALAQLRRDCGYDPEPADTDDDGGGVDALIDYKNALEDAYLSLAGEVLAVHRYLWPERYGVDADGRPLGPDNPDGNGADYVHEWRGADTMQDVAGMIDAAAAKLPGYPHERAPLTRRVSVTWETDGETIADLPAVVDMPAHVDAEDVAEWLSDHHGWLVQGWAPADPPAETPTAAYHRLYREGAGTIRAARYARRVLADTLDAEGWPSVADDVRDGVAFAVIVTRLGDIGERGSPAAALALETCENVPDVVDAAAAAREIAGRHFNAQDGDWHILAALARDGEITDATRRAVAGEIAAVEADAARQAAIPELLPDMRRLADLLAAIPTPGA